jgi:uncharacterized protein DUF6461
VGGCSPHAERRIGGVPAPSGNPRATTATAADYAWFQQEIDLAKGFCFTWVKGFTPAQVLDRLGSHELERVGWQQLVGSGNGPRGFTDKYLIGVARIGGWTLIVEDNGAMGTTDALVRPLSTGTTLVSHYRAGDGHGRFLLLEDREVRLDFDPLDVARRTGSGAGELTGVIDQAGFGLAEQIAKAADPVRYRTYCMEAAFALAERFTGIAMTHELLENRQRTYLLAEVARN